MHPHLHFILLLLTPLPLTLSSPLPLQPRQSIDTNWTVTSLTITTAPSHITFTWSNSTTSLPCSASLASSPNTEGLVPCSPEDEDGAVLWSYDGTNLGFDVSWADCGLDGYMEEIGSLALPSQTTNPRLQYWPSVVVPIQRMALAGFSPSEEAYYCGGGGSGRGRFEKGDGREGSE